MAFQPFPILGRALRRGLGSSGRAGGGGVVYLLRDLFTTDRAAGAVNGTPAEPTGQTRTVTDTNNKLSIAGGVLSFATGGVGAGDPSIWYPIQARLAGKILLGILNSASGNGATFGWDTDQSGGVVDGLRFNSTALTATIAGSPIAVGVIVNSINYLFAVIMRSSGVFLLIKGGVFTNWTLVYLSTVTNSSMYPNVGIITGTTSVFVADDIRIPQNLYIPSPLAYDTFTRANGALGSTETVGPDAQVLVALAWLFTVGIWAISTNKAVATPTLGADVIVNGGFGADTDWTKGAGWTIAAGLATATAASSDLQATVNPLTVGRWYQVTYTVSGFAAGTINARIGNSALPLHAANGTFTEIGRALDATFLMRGSGFTGSVDNVICKLLTTVELFASVVVSTADVIVDVAVTLAGANASLAAGIVINLDSTSNPQNFICCYLDGKGAVSLEEYVAGVPTLKFNSAVTYSAGAVLRVIRDGTSCRVFYNNAAVSTVQTMTANTNLNHGVFSVDPTNNVDNFTIWPRGTANEYAALDAY